MPTFIGVRHPNVGIGFPVGRPVFVGRVGIRTRVRTRAIVGRSSRAEKPHIALRPASWEEMDFAFAFLLFVAMPAYLIFVATAMYKCGALWLPTPRIPLSPLVAAYRWLAVWFYEQPEEVE